MAWHPVSSGSSQTQSKHRHTVTKDISAIGKEEWGGNVTLSKEMFSGDGETLELRSERRMMENRR